MKKYEEHITDHAMESFALGHLPDAELFPFQSHIENCESCQDRLRETLDYTRLMRAGLKQASDNGTNRSGWIKPVLGLAAGVLAVLLGWPVLRQSGAPQTIELAAVRDSQSAHYPSGRSIDLKLAAPAGAASTVRLEIVNLNGGRVWSGEGRLTGNRWIAAVETELPAGSYWVRAYAPGSAEPVREYALRLD